MCLRASLMPEVAKGRLLPRLKARLIIGGINALALFARRRPRSVPEKVKRIGLMQFGGLGDMVLATPVIRALANAYPEADITLICSHPGFAEFMRRFENVTAIKGFDVYALDARTLWRRQARKQFLAMRRFLRKGRFDLIVNLHVPALIDWWVVELLLIAASKTGYAIGFQPPWLRLQWPYDAAIDVARPLGRHYTQLYADLLRTAGLSAEQQTFFPLTEGDRVKARQLLQTHGINADTPYVCLHAGARRLALEGKMWPAESFAALACMLQQKGWRPVLLGAAGEEETARVICGVEQGCVNLIGKTDACTLAALIEGARLFVGHDSGPFHIAVAVGTPAVAICPRPDAEAEYLDYPNGRVSVIQADAPERIAIETVHMRALAMLQGEGEL